MYCRYTQFSYAPGDRDSILRFWDEVGGPAAAPRGGFQGALILDSIESEGTLRALTFWKEASDFEEFFADGDHERVIEGIRLTSMTTGDRDGLEVVSQVKPEADLVRLVRCSVKEGAADGFRKFWRARGRELAETDRGCIKAEAFLDAEASEAVLCFHWRTFDEAEAFLRSDLHENVLAPGLEQFLTPIARLHTESL